jgi:hypothetical protein
MTGIRSEIETLADEHRCYHFRNGCQAPMAGFTQGWLLSMPDGKTSEVKVPLCAKHLKEAGIGLA